MRLMKKTCICIVLMLAVFLCSPVISHAAGQTFTVSFDAGGGSGEMEAVTVEEGEMLVLPECGFEAPENKTFEKWELGEPGEEIEIVEDTIITAQWAEPEEPIRVGWVNDNGVWFFYNQDGIMQKNSWAADSIGWCWLDGNGMITKDKWIEYNDTWYYLKPNGYMAAGEWAMDSKGWCWLSGSGKMVKDKWLYYKNAWYYLKPSGYMAASEWARDTKGWYWLSGSGKMVKDKWLYYKNAWYYLKPNGRMASGEWARDTRGWCWLMTNGKAAASRWILDGKEWYYIKSNLHMAANEWAADSTHDCYMGASGKIVYMTRKQAGAVVYKPAPNRQNGKLVVLDPGHSRILPSGIEPIGPGSSTMKAKTSSGTCGVSTGIDEYEMNMTISKALRTELLSRGYMSNSTEDRWMANASNQKLMVKGLANGIDRFFK